MTRICIAAAAALAALGASVRAAAEGGGVPLPLDSYQDPAGAGLWAVLRHRAAADPVNLTALAIFVAAVVHTFLTASIRRRAHAVELRHHAALRARRAARPPDAPDEAEEDEVSFAAEALHFLGEVEVVFGLWAVVLAGAITWFKGWTAAVGYIGEHVSYTEPLFVVVVMALAATRPVLGLAERCLRGAASLGGGTPAAWWLALLLLAPLLGSLITEPAAMTIAALLLSRQFYDLKPGGRLAYATLGLLFVNVSVGGTLTHFAAPPVIMVAHAWHWGLVDMFTLFGWKAVVGIAASTLVYYAVFRRELAALGTAAAAAPAGPRARRRAPAWVTAVQLGFLAFIVGEAHQPVLFVGAFLFFLAFAQTTKQYQSPVDLRRPILVGFFLAGLVIHGGLQAWWLQPVLVRLGERPLFFGATALTAFNDNAAITYLASLVPGFTEPLKHAVVAGAVAGGGLTVIANAPNPAGQSLLARHFPGGVSPLKLFAGALVPTGVVSLCFLAL